jgi:predicted transcriptional regulator
MTKLNRSETVTIRLDPRMKYLAEMAGRAQRRTKSSFIEWAIEQAVAELGIEAQIASQEEAVTVPRNPTPAMIAAAVKTAETNGYTDIVAIWKAMVEASEGLVK